VRLCVSSLGEQLAGGGGFWIWGCGMGVWRGKIFFGVLLFFFFF